MSAILLPDLKPQYFDDNGAFLVGGKLWSYIAGTTTPLATYSDPDGLSPNTNPIILDSRAEANIYLGNSTYKFVLTDANDVTIWTKDDVSVAQADSIPSSWATHAITDGQSSTDLSGETVDFALYSSALYDVEIIRGTATFASGQIAIQNVNGAGRVCAGMFMCNEGHGVVFSVTQAAMIVTLQAQTDSGPGDGTIKLSRKLVPV